MKLTTSEGIFELVPSDTALFVSREEFKSFRCFLVGKGEWTYRCVVVNDEFYSLIKHKA
jgi:hypothetical protein